MIVKCKIVPQEDTNRNDKCLYKMAVKVTKKVKYAMVLYLIANSMRSTLCMVRRFHDFSKIKSTTFVLCHSSCN